MNQKRTPADERRSRWFADPRLQCGLLARTILYWLYSVGAIGAMALLWIVFVKHPQTSAQWVDQLWLNCGPLAAGSILILPLVLLDCVRYSRRFAGPMVRFRRALNDLANGEAITPIHLREDDFWCEFARDLNRISDRVRAQDANGTSVGVAAAGSDQAADTRHDAMEETTDFIAPRADAPSPERPAAGENSPAAISAIATDVCPPVADGSPPVADLYA